MSVSDIIKKYSAKKPLVYVVTDNDACLSYCKFKDNPMIGSRHCLIDCDHNSYKDELGLYVRTK